MSERNDISSICEREDSVGNDEGKAVGDSGDETVIQEITSDINGNTCSLSAEIETTEIINESNEHPKEQDISNEPTAVIDAYTSQSQDKDSSVKKTGVEHDDIHSDHGNKTKENTEGGKNEEEIAEDESDMFKLKNIKKILKCGPGKSKLLDEDQTPYGVHEKENNQVTKQNVRTIDKPVKQSSFQEAMTNLISEELAEETFSTIKVDDKKAKSVKPQPVKENYISQSNIQRYPDPKKIYSAQSNPDRYNFSHPQRGFMVMIVNDRFRMESFRDGAHWDLKKMREFARKFGFRIFNHDRDRNVTKAETLRLLRGAQQMDHSESDCFAFMISSHGLEMRNPRAGGKKDHALICSDDQYIFISDILDMFSDTNCPTLKNKPKIFIVQACRGASLDHGGDLFVMHPSRPVDKTCGVQQADFVTPKISRGKPKRESFDETDTHPGNDSWASKTTPGQVSAIGGLPCERLRYSAEPSGVRYNPPLPRGQEGAVGGLPATHAHYGTATISQYGQASFQQRSPFFSPVQGTLRPPGFQTHSSQSINKVNVPTTPYAVCETPSLKCGNDMLILYAIPPGMFAWRNTSDGSWMIDYFHQVMMAYDLHTPKNFLSLLTKVSFLMSTRETYTPSDPTTHRKKAVPVIEHALTRDIYFQPKAVLSSWTRKNLEFSL